MKPAPGNDRPKLPTGQLQRPLQGLLLRRRVILAGLVALLTLAANQPNATATAAPAPPALQSPVGSSSIPDLQDPSVPRIVPPETPAPEIREAMGQVNPAWFDRKTGDIRWSPFSPAETAVSANRHLAEEAEPPEPKKKTTVRKPASSSFLPTLITVTALAFLLLIVIGIAVWLAMQWTSDPTDNPDRKGVRTDQTRIENLPFQLTPDLRDLRAAALRAASQGDFRQAIIWLYSSTLVDLDRQQRLELRKGKTNRQYMSEAALRGVPESAFRPLMMQFEAVFFGAAPADQAGFDRCLAQNEQILASPDRPLPHDPEPVPGGAA